MSPSLVRPDQSIEGFVCFSIESADAASLQLVLTPTDTNSGPVILNTITPTPPEADDFGPEEAVAALIEEGADAAIVVSPQSRLEFLPRSSIQYVLCLDTQQASLYEYASEALREADSNTIRPTGNPQDGAIDLAYGRLMWWAKGRVIVNYNLADPWYWDALATVLGETISPAGTDFGDPPDPLPPSDLCS